MIHFPPYLKPGNTIGITCPAGYMHQDKVSDCINTLQSWGYEVVVGKTIGGNSQNYFSATDTERKEELQEMLDNKKIHAILFGRGGYGTSRIIDDLDFKKFLKKPKWLVGFSDITVMHMHLFSRFKFASIHGPMAAAFSDDRGIDSINSLNSCLKGIKASYTTQPNTNNKKGNATGILIGGNLALLCNVIGTPSDFDTKGKILFIEDIGEYIYNLDRMLYQLKRSGKLKKIKALILGGFTDMKDTERPFGKTTQEVLKELTENLDCPVCFDFPVSHTYNNHALKIGATYSLSVKETLVTLREL